MSSTFMLPGVRLGPYEILAPLGKGGMGEVFKARDTRLDRMVAIKICNEQFNERFEREARAVAALNHPNICTLHDVGPNYLVMEYIEGSTLANRIDSGPIPPAEALPIAHQIAEALEVAHARGIIHRDLKPANIKLARDGKVKILDFGLAKMLPGQSARVQQEGLPANTPTLTLSATRQGMIVGTPGYMSPEQARGVAVDKRTDVWAFGCVLYEMLTGERAFGGDLATEKLASVLKDEPKWRLLADTIPAALQRLLRRCLAKELPERLRDLGDAQIEIREALSELAAGDQTVRVPSAPQRGRRAVLWVSAVLATALVSGLGVWRVMRRSDAPTAPAERLMIALPASAIVRPGGRSLAISPDGNTLVYVGPGEGPSHSRLYVRAFDAYEPRPLDGTDGASAPFFSPDGQSVGFFAAGRLKRIPVTGGSATTICEAPENTGGSGGAWGPDNTIIFAAPTSARLGLFRVSALGGAPEVLTTPDPAEEGSYGDPVFVSGSRTVLFTTRLTKAGVKPSLMVYSLATKEQHKVPGVGDAGRVHPPSAPLNFEDSQPKYTSKGYLLFKRNSTIMAAAIDPSALRVTGQVMPIVEDVGEFDVSLSGRIVYSHAPEYGGQLVWVDRKGSNQPVLEDQYQRFGRPRLSPNGSELGVEVLRGTRSDIGVYRFSSRTLTLLTTDGVSNSPYWHPDGRSIVFRAPSGLLRSPTAGATKPEILLAASDPAFPEASLLAPGVFSPGDASVFLFVVHGSARTGADIYKVRLGRDRRIEPLVQRPGNQWAVRISPDGKWISYASDESGRFKVYLEASTGGQARYQVSNDGGSEAVWSPTGNELFYRNGDTMMAVPITNNPDSPAGAPHLLFTGRYQRTELPQYDVTNDGQRFLMVKPIVDDVDARTLRIVDGWLLELGRHESSSR